MCNIVRRTGRMLVDTKWEGSFWKDIPSESLQNYMGDQPEHVPATEVKIAYDSSAVALIFRVEDRYVRAVASGYQDNVCCDSCVEFFFTPGSDISAGYFNLEVNCGGTKLFHFQPEPRTDQVLIPEEDGDQIEVFHSLPRIVDPEITEPITWTVACRIPFDILEKYCSMVRPETDVVWRANFYKCATLTSHPHWLTWAPVDSEKPNFHVPGSFGELRFK